MTVVRGIHLHYTCIHYVQSELSKERYISYSLNAQTSTTRPTTGDGSVNLSVAKEKTRNKQSPHDDEITSSFCKLCTLTCILNRISKTSKAYSTILQ